MKNIRNYQLAVTNAVSWLESHLQSDGAYRQQTDLACYYKSPYLFALLGKVDQANRILDFVKTNFMSQSGDFSQKETKSENVVFNEYWTYINGWLALSAHRLGRFDISIPAYRYLKSSFHPELKTYITQAPFAKDLHFDVLTAAHLGLCSLYFYDLEKARGAALYLQRMLEEQRDLEHNFYLRMDAHGRLIENFAPESAFLYCVKNKEPQQAFFMLGYAPAFLAKFYEATGEQFALKTARKYLDFCLTCSHIKSFVLSHKVAWGAHLIAEITSEKKYAALAHEIAGYLVTTQDTSGCWLKDFPSHTRFDQTAEIAIWLKQL